MTTNESQKWTEWKDDMQDGYVFKGNREALQTYNRQRNASRTVASVNPALSALLESDEIFVPWPIKNDEVLVRTKDGKAPRGQESLWETVRSLDEIVNVYDLGVWRNMTGDINGR